MTYAVNIDDVKQQLRDAGLVLDRDLVCDAHIQRWRVDDEGRERRGWSRLKEWTSKAGHTYIVGAYGVWRGNDDGYMRVELHKDSNGGELSAEDRAAIKAAQKESARKVAEERKREAKTAAAWAAVVWSRCEPCAEHEYLTRKGVRSHGLRKFTTLDGIIIDRLDDSNRYRLEQAIGALVAPMHDAHGNVNGIQFIYPRGHERAKKIESDKEFWPAGMAMGGTFGLIGPIRRDGVLLVTEGYATAASLREATDQSVAYAFAANNLAKAGKLLRKLYPKLRLLFCADDDYLKRCTHCKKATLTDVERCGHCGLPHGQSNSGVIACAQATAEIERSSWIKPDFLDADGNDRRAGKKFTDYNDLAQLTASPLVLANQINAKLDELQWRDAAPAARAATQQGGGEERPPGDKRPRACSVMTLDDLVDRFVPLDDGTGKYVFDVWTNKIAHRDQMAAILPAGMRGDDIKRHPVWLQRGAYYLDQVGFDPTGKDKNVALNTWRGWPMTPQSGSCDRLLELLEYLCGGEQTSGKVFGWVLRWMAYPLQHPGAKMNSAIIMHGAQGTGKSAIWQAYAKIYGDYATVLNQRGLEDKFNADWADSKLFILAEEVVTRQEMWHIKNELKELVTGEWVRINPKNIAAYRQKNQVNIAYLSNENQPLPIENDDRRHCVIYTPPALDETFYDEVFLEIENGGVEALYHHLLHLDLGDFHPKKRPPMTEAKQSLINLSLASDMRFIAEWIGGDTHWPLVPCLACDLYSAYLRWCKLNGETRPRPSNQFHGAVGRLPGWEKKKTRVYDDCRYLGGTKPKPMVFPPSHLLDAAGTAKPPAQDLARWLTDCIHDFKNGETAGGGEI